MLTLNYKKWMQSRSMNNTTSFSGIDVTNASRTLAGNSASAAQDEKYFNYSATQNYVESAGYATTSNGYSFIHIGTGTTTPTEQDHCLSSVVSASDVSHDNGSIDISDTGKITFVQTFTYGGANDIEISEIGLFKLIRQKESYDSKFTCLLARELLENPISVSTGDTFTVTMTIG